MKKLLYIFSILFLASCSKEELNPYPCLDGNCNVGFWIDKTVQPDTYQDENGFWHIRHWGPNYFTIKGDIDQLNEEYVVNDVPLVETTFDSNYWFWINAVQFTIPLYNPFRDFADPQFSRPLPIGNKILKICNMTAHGIVSNLAGYAYHDKVCEDCPYSDRLMGTYSSNTYTPQQQFHLDRSMKGDTLEIYMKTVFNYDLGESEEIYRSLRIIIDNE